VETGLPLIATNCVRNDLLYPAFDKIRYVSKETYENWFRGHPVPGDLIFVCKGTPGRVCMTPDPVSFCIAQDMVAVRADPKKVYPKYLFALLRSPQVQAKIGNMHVGTLIPHFKKGDFDKLLLPVPDKKTQETVGDTYFELSDKIELNRRMNATLEAMARALFQSWFVDFDPVRAKLDGRHPAALDPATAALFPEHLEDSPLGHIPKGWEVKTVGDIGDVICGKTPPTSVADYYGQDIPFITIPDMHGNVFGAATARKLSHAGANSQANKTLPPGSLCVSCIATPGLVVITSEDSQTNQQINSVVPHQKEETYFWYWVMNGLGAEIASSGSGGSVLVNLSKGRFETLQVVKPPHALIRAYHTTVRPLFEAILANTHQSRTLATLRDTLLPKLLSGELSVAEDNCKGN
jgi:type I restriction enzyme S subunit